VNVKAPWTSDPDQEATFQPAVADINRFETYSQLPISDPQTERYLKLRTTFARQISHGSRFGPERVNEFETSGMKV
jgi:hypothetical protein